jgi:hypothetical protein
MASALSAVAAPAGAMPPWIPSASDGTGAWLAVERAGKAGPEAVLLHHAEGMGADRAREAMVLPSPPEAMAASDGTLWVVLPPRGSDRRETYSLRAERHPASGAWISLPPGRMDLHPAVPPGPPVTAMAADADGPIVQRADGGLLRLADGAWVAEPGVRPAPGARLGSLRGRPALVDPSTRSVLVRVRGSGWSAAEVTVPGDGFVRLVDGARTPVALCEAGGALRIEHLRPGASVPLEPFVPEPRPIAVVGCGPRLLAFTGTGTGGAVVSEIDPLSGRRSDGTLVRPPESAGARIATMVVLVAAAGAMLAAVAARRFLRLKPPSGERR